jgi:DnaJ-class molecular chaperone
MRDPYQVLGVSKSASAAEIKSAYRKLAKKLHPDANKHDTKAASRFAELNAAYEIVGDADKRKAFDRGEIDAEGKPRFRGFEHFGAGRGGARPGSFGEGVFEAFSFGPEGFQRSAGRPGAGGFGGFEDILKGVFSNMGGGARGAQTRGGSWLDEEDAASAPSGDVTASLVISLAEAAKGASKRVRLPTGKEVDVKVPAGLAEGRQIRLKGQGRPGARGRAGDALVTVTVAPHPIFQREGKDLRVELPIALYEAVLGGKLRVPTLDGAVELNLPPETNSGRTFRLRGKGFPAQEGTGDLLVSVRIVLPERSDPEFEALMRKWRDAKPYHPRQGQPDSS